MRVNEASDTDPVPRRSGTGRAPYHQMVAECERRRTAAEASWRAAVAARGDMAITAEDGSDASLRLEAADDLVAAAAERFEAAVDRLAAARMLQRAYVAELTGALSRSVGEQHLRHEVERAQRESEPLAVAFVDVDGLKQVNDQDGHLAGDAVLRAVGQSLREGLRSYDVIVRFGGDEFVCALPGATLSEARRRIEQVRHHLGELSSDVSISVGLAELADTDALSDVLWRADAHLYSARAVRRSAAVPPPGQAHDLAAG